jgi:hypothetical protein
MECKKMVEKRETMNLINSVAYHKRHLTKFQDAHFVGVGREEEHDAVALAEARVNGEKARLADADRHFLLAVAFQEQLLSKTGTELTCE